MPAEHEIHCRVGAGGDTFPYLPGIMHQKHERDVLAGFLDFGSKGEDVLVDIIVHADDDVDIRFALQHKSCSGCGLGPDECRRVGHVQSDIFLVNLRFNLSVLLHDECVIIAAYHQYSLDPEFNKRIVVRALEIFRPDECDVCVHVCGPYGLSALPHCGPSSEFCYCHGSRDSRIQ